MHAKKAKVPRVSTVLVRPVGLKTDKPGVYSIDFQFGTKHEVSASDIRVKTKTKSIIDVQQHFECSASKSTDKLKIVLYNDREEEIALGQFPLFTKFAYSNFEETFDPLVLA